MVFTDPQMLPDKEEFILFSTRSKVERYVFDDHRKEPVANNLRSVVAVEYDYHSDCAFWADVELDIIQVGAQEYPVLYAMLPNFKDCKNLVVYTLS